MPAAVLVLSYIYAMHIDAITKAGPITRAVDTVDRDGTPAKLLTASRSYATSIDDIWDAVTYIQRNPRWFLPITGDLRPGGRYQLEGNAGGEVLACDPPHRFEITWEYEGEISWVTVELTGDPGTDEAYLQLRHLAHVPEEMWDQFGPGAVGIGWDLGLMGLDLSGIDTVERWLSGLKAFWQQRVDALDTEIARGKRER